MEEILLPQETYDLLIKRCNQNHKAHNKLSDFDFLSKQIQKYTRTTMEGPWVKAKILEIAEGAFEKNIALAGKKYQTAADDMLLFAISEARAEQADRVAQLQSLQQDVGKND